MRHLYATLWRVGLLEVHSSDGQAADMPRDIGFAAWAFNPVESGGGIDPAITGEPSEERPVRPNAFERVGPSQPPVERRASAWQRDNGTAFAQRGVVPSLDCRHAVLTGAGAWETTRRPVAHIKTVAETPDLRHELEVPRLLVRDDTFGPALLSY